MGTFAVNIFLSAVAAAFWIGGVTSREACACISAFTAIHALAGLAKTRSIPCWGPLFAALYTGLFLIFIPAATLCDFEVASNEKIVAHYCHLSVTGFYLFRAGYTFLPLRRRVTPADPLPVRAVERLVFLFAGFLIVGIAMIVVDAGSVGALASRSRGDMKLSLGILSTASVYFLMAGSFFYPLLGGYCRCRRHLIMNWIPLLLFVELMLFLAFRTRSVPLTHAIGLGVGWCCINVKDSSGLRRSPKRSASRRIMTAALAVSLAISMMALRMARGQYENATSLDDFQLDLSTVLDDALRSGDLAYGAVVMRALEVVPSKFDYLQGQSYYRIFFLPIPRSVWPDKPRNTQAIVAKWIDPNCHESQTTPAGVIGDLYINFGNLGILGMMVFGSISRSLDRSNSIAGILLFSISVAPVFHIVRGGFTNPIVHIAICGIVAIWIEKRLREKSSPIYTRIFEGDRSAIRSRERYTDRGLAPRTTRMRDSTCCDRL